MLAVLRMTKLTAILLPGFDGTGKMFGPLLQCLPDWIEAQVMDYPTQQVLSYAELAEHVLQRLPAGNFIFIAESFAGPLALMVRERIPDRVQALVLACTFLTNPRPWLAKIGRPFIRDWILAIKPSHWMAKIFVTGFDISDAMLRYALDIHETVAPAVSRHRLYEIFAVDVREQLQRCNVPVLHLYANHDHLVLKYSMREIQRVRPDIPSIGIDGPHYLYQMRPRQCSEQIEKFLRCVNLDAAKKTAN